MRYNYYILYVLSQLLLIISNDDDEVEDGDDDYVNWNTRAVCCVPRPGQCMYNRNGVYFVPIFTYIHTSSGIGMNRTGLD